MIDFEIIEWKVTTTKKDKNLSKHNSIYRESKINIHTTNKGKGVVGSLFKK